MNAPLRYEHLYARMAEIRAHIARINRYVSLSDEEFFSDERNLYTVEHLLLMCIESAASICTHIMARMADAAPSSYADCFLSLNELGVIDGEIAGNLIQAARFRNLLIHQYWSVEEQRILQIAREHTEDFEIFVKQVGEWLEQQ